MVNNWLVLTLVLTLTLIFGLFALLSPIGVARLLAHWYRFAFLGTLREQNARPSVRDALRLIDQDPVEYARRFNLQLLIIRVTGIISLLLFAAALLVVFASTMR